MPDTVRTASGNPGRPAGRGRRGAVRAAMAWLAPFLLAVASEAAWCAWKRPPDGHSLTRVLVDVLPEHGLLALALALGLLLPDVAWPWRRGRPPLGARALASAVSVVIALHVGQASLHDVSYLGHALLPAGWAREASSALLVALAVYVPLRLASGLLLSLLSRSSRLRAASEGPLLPALALLLVVLVGVGNLLLPPLPGRQADRRLATLARRPNILVVVADTLRKDRLGAYGYDRHPTSPAIDAFAAQSTLFERAYANSSWTIPSMASLLTGRWMVEHGACAEVRLLDDTWPTLPAILSAYGYRTMAVSSNSMINGRDQGYLTDFAWVEDTSTDPTRPNRIRRPGPDPFVLRELLHTLTGAAAPFFKVVLEPNPGDLGVRETTDAALQLAAMAQRDDRPFLLFMDYMANHMPYQFPPGFEPPFARAPKPPGREWDPIVRAASVPAFPSIHMFYWRQYQAALGLSPYDEADDVFLSDLYDATVAYLDSEFARLLAGLDQLGLMEETIVVFTSDHGESLGEETDFGHGRVLARQLVEVPLVIHDPGRPGGRHVEHPVQSIDLLPTLLAALGIPQADVSPLPLRGSDLFGPPGSAPIVAELHYNTGPPDWSHAAGLALWMDQIFQDAAIQREMRSMRGTLAELAAVLAATQAAASPLDAERTATLRQDLQRWVDLCAQHPRLLADILRMPSAALDEPLGPSLPGASFRDFRDYYFPARRLLVTDRWLLQKDSTGRTELHDALTGERLEAPPRELLQELEQQLATWQASVHPHETLRDRPRDLSHLEVIPYLR